MAQICLRGTHFTPFSRSRKRNISSVVSRHFSLSATGSSNDASEAKAILTVEKASEYCKSNVKKFDYYAYRIAEHFPKKQQPYYFAIN